MINIRTATLDDIPQMVVLYEKALKREANPNYIRTSIENYPVFVAENDGIIIGFVYTRKFSPDILEIANILLDASARGEGIGQQLLEHVEASATRYDAIILVNSTLYTEADDKRDASNFYLKCGYSVILQTSGSKVFSKSLKP